MAAAEANGAVVHRGEPEGSCIMIKTLGDKTLLARHLRNYLELLFGPATPPART